MSKPIVAIVGRPNVGKSTLFNVLAGDNISIVKDTPGVTRDRIYADVEWLNHKFTLVDTGGIEPESKDIILSQMRDQAQIAIDTANVIIFITDVRQGLVDADAKVADMLRRSRKPVVLVVNKVDNFDRQMMDVYEFYNLGIGEPHAISASGKLGIGDMLDEVTGYFDPEMENEEESEIPRIAIVGKPNVGKSSLVNKLLGSNRVIVSDIAGTTRDAIDIPFTLKCGDEDVSAVLVDTAGLRKKSKIDEAVERYSMMRAEEALENADIVLFVIEATTLVSTSQDKTIARMIQDSGKGCIIIANKWDACSGVKQKTLLEDLRASLPKMLYAPLILLSAKSGYNLRELFEAIAELRAQMSVKVSTAMLNRILTDAQVRNVPPIIGGRPFKIYYGTMVGNCPPRFSLFVNDPKLCADNYKAYLENYMRKAFSFTGFPIRIFMKARRREDLNEILAKKKMFKRKREEEKRRNFKPSRQEDDGEFED